jgi:hypothetical protein
MSRYEGIILSKGSLKTPLKSFYCKINNISNNMVSQNCVIIPNLSPDFSIILSQADIIIASQGSLLSHLAILGREFLKTIILSPKISNAPDKGKILFEKIDDKNNVIIKIELEDF